MPPPLPIETLADRLATLHRRVVATSAAETSTLQHVHPRNLASADNLLDYLALRSSDLRGLQTDLARHGLSSLGRAEAHVEATLQATCRACAALAGRPAPAYEEPLVGFDEGPEQLDTNAEALFGPASPGRTTRIMVTLPPEAAEDPGLVAEYVAAGATVFRINTAHEGPAAWSAMISHIRAAEEGTGRHFPVVMDLAGPKLRTGPIAPGPQVVRFRPRRDALGRVVEATTVTLSAGSGATAADTATSVGAPEAIGLGLPASTLPVTDAGWLDRRRPGDRIRFTDARGSTRKLLVESVASGSGSGVAAAATVTCLLADTGYVVPGTVLSVGDDRTTVGPLPPVEQRLRIHLGDHLRLVADLTPAAADATPPTIGCTLPEVFRDTAVGQRVALDDGKIAGHIVAVGADRLELAVTDVAPNGAWLGAKKGINLPDTDLDLPALTAVDREALPFVVRHADVVDLSFARTAEDIDDLRAELDRLGAPDFPIIVKLETMSAFRHLPDILLAAMASPHVGAMIARGDLAVEAGYVRMGEIQEEIMWICEAAHVPVVWATQVLDDLAKRGRPARAEVTDAATSGRAECVMLNKGPFIPVAIRFLDQLLTRMEGHQDKKASLLRRLRLSGRGSEL